MEQTMQVTYDTVEVETSSGRIYRSFQVGKDSVESAKQEAEFIK